MVSFHSSVDTTQATAADRVKSYINGEQILSANNGYSAENYPSQNDDIIVNNTVQHNIGRNYYSSPSGLWAGDMAHFHFTDGTLMQLLHLVKLIQHY